MNRLRKKQRGFSLIELLVVLAIMLAVSAIALPSFMSFTATSKLRSVMQQASGMLQQLRMEAVRRNTNLQIRTTTSGSQVVAYADLDNSSTWQPNEPSMMLPASVTVTSTGHPGDATTGLGYTPQTGSGVMPQFNSRGLPCVMGSGGFANVCQNYDSDANAVGFVVYFKNLSSLGGAQWGAITITPAGRVRTWIWNGGSYSGL